MGSREGGIGIRTWRPAWCPPPAGSPAPAAACSRRTAGQAAAQLLPSPQALSSSWQGISTLNRLEPAVRKQTDGRQPSGMRGALDAGLGSVSGQMKTHKGPAPGEVAALKALRVPVQQVRQDVNAQCADTPDQRHCCGVGSLKSVCFRGSAMPRQAPAMKEYQSALCSHTAGCVPKKPAHHLATEP